MPSATTNGVLVVAKPAGPTSHDVVALVRRLSGAKRVGHGGTLDPFASGVLLPVFIGSATRIVEYHLRDAKAYRAVASLRCPVDHRRHRRRADARRGPGSHARVGRGRPARLPGHVVQRPAGLLGRPGRPGAGHTSWPVAASSPSCTTARWTIHELRLTDWDDADPARPCATLEVRCSAGTYVRALARDLGDRLRCGGYLGALERTASGPFRIEDAIPLDDLRRLLVAGSLGGRLLPPDVGLDAYPEVTLSPDELAAIARGQVVRLRGEEVEPGPDGLVRIVAAGRGVVAMAHLREHRLYPDKVLAGAAG